ncbi:hypothetical protein [Massilia sp. 9096]|uniref:hypothetical protein n=1 Tax=Massilia sp. 9096 TaxID=1500894 RepID=UPI000565FF46|nr:hypothetical protein [Massilia sp. 9096]
MAKQPVNPGDVDLDAMPTPAPEGTDLGKNEAAKPPPESKTGSDDRPGAGGNATTRGPGGPDSGSDAMPGQSNAL